MSSLDFFAFPIAIDRTCGSIHGLMSTSEWTGIPLKNLLNEHFKETQSKVAEKILKNFATDVKSFKQVCPKEMLDKLQNPLTMKSGVLKAI